MMDHLNEDGLNTSKNDAQTHEHSNTYLTSTPSTTSSSTLTSEAQIHYMPVASPPTPAPSPRPAIDELHSQFHLPFPPFALGTNHPLRREYLSAIITSCSQEELIFMSQMIRPLLKPTFEFNLPDELVMNVFTFFDDHYTLLSAGLVNKQWYRVSRDENIWHGLCIAHNYTDWEDDEIDWRRRQKKYHKYQALKIKATNSSCSEQSQQSLEEQNSFHPPNAADPPSTSSVSYDIGSDPPLRRFSFWRFYRNTYITNTNWRRGGKLLNSHRLPIHLPDTGTVTSFALDRKWLVIGLSSSMIKVYDARTGVFMRSLMGHDSGVWGVCLVSAGGERVPERPEQGTSESDGDDRPSEQDTHRAGSSSEYIGHKPRRKDSNTARAGSSNKGVDDLGSRVAGLNLRSSHGALHVMINESLAHLVSPEMQFALGLDPASLASSSSDDEKSDGASSRRAPRGTGHKKQKKQKDQGKKQFPERRRRSQPPSTTADGAAADGADGFQDEATPHIPAFSASNLCYASKGWGQPNPIIVSGGCDKVIRVWDLKSGQCIYVLHGHVSTIRSLRVLDGRPIAVTGSRDATLRVWDVQRGICLRVLEGHQASVRCLDVSGDKVVSGSYDSTCRLWNIDTGECLHVLEGHFSQIYSVAFDGVRIASGGLDTTVRIWDAETGQCVALLGGHTALVCQLQLSPTLLATGGADGRVITFSLETYTVLHRIAAHDSSVTALQFDQNVLVTGGNDGRVKVFEARTGAFVREVTEPSEGVWKVAFVKGTCAVMCKRAGKTVVEIWNMDSRRRRSAMKEAVQDGAG